MDGECVLLMPRVCELLSKSGKSLPDDTSLEKLLDWFTGLINGGKYQYVTSNLSVSLVPFRVESDLTFIVVCSNK